MKVVLSERVIEALGEAPPNVRRAFNKQLRFLIQNLHHPSLHAKKYDEARDLWQARVNRDWRFYFTIRNDLYRSKMSSRTRNNPLSRKPSAVAMDQWTNYRLKRRSAPEADRSEPLKSQAPSRFALVYPAAAAGRAEGLPTELCSATALTAVYQDQSAVGRSPI